MADDSFTEFVLDQLRALGALNCRAMFGGHGLYHEGVFFGMVFKGRLYFKTDAKTRAEYLKCGMKPFCPSPRQTLKNYYEVPIDVIEDDEQLARWAQTAMGV
ncbi:MAG: TfoX/Sxy family protein [Nitrospinales bacterium]